MKSNSPAAVFLKLLTKCSKVKPVYFFQRNNLKLVFLHRI